MAQDTSTTTSSPAISSGAGTQLFMGLLWLGTTVWTTHAAITGNTDDLSGVLGEAAAALPGLIAAMLLTSASIASAAGSRFESAGRRLLTGLGVGVVFGLIAAVGIRFAYTATPSITVLAVAVGAAGVLGGISAGLPNAVLEAGLWATSWVFFAGVIFGVLETQLTTMLGGGPTADAAAQAAASTRFFYGQAALTGLLAAVHCFRNLRNEQPALPWFVLAGALPGLLLLAAEGLTRLGGKSLLELIDGDSTRLRYAVIVLVVSAVVVTISALRSRNSSEA